MINTLERYQKALPCVGSVLKDKSMVTRRNQGAEGHVGTGEYFQMQRTHMSWEGERQELKHQGAWSAGNPRKAPQRRLGDSRATPLWALLAKVRISDCPQELPEQATGAKA